MSQFTKLILFFIVLISLSFCYEIVEAIDGIQKAGEATKILIISLYLKKELLEFIFIGSVIVLFVLKLKGRKTNYLLFYFLLFYSLFHLLMVCFIILNVRYNDSVINIGLIIYLLKVFYCLIISAILCFKVKDLKQDETLYFSKSHPKLKSFFPIFLGVCSFFIMQQATKILYAFSQMKTAWYYHLFFSTNGNSLFNLFFFFIACILLIRLIQRKTQALIAFSMFLFFYCIIVMGNEVVLFQNLFQAQTMNIDFWNLPYIILDLLYLISCILILLFLPKSFKQHALTLNPIEP